MFQPSPFSKSTQDLSITTAILSKSSQRWQLIKPELIQGVSSHPHCLQVKSLLWKCNSLCKHPAITSNPYLLLCCRPRYFYCIGTLLCYVIILWPSLSFTDKGTWKAPASFSCVILPQGHASQRPLPGTWSYSLPHPSALYKNLQHGVMAWSMIEEKQMTLHVPSSSFSVCGSRDTRDYLRWCHQAPFPLWGLDTCGRWVPGPGFMKTGVNL